MAEVWGKVYEQKKAGEKSTFWARLRYTDPVTGKRCEYKRRAKSKRDASDLVDRLKQERAAKDRLPVLHDRHTFADLADFFEAEYVKEPIFRGNRKVGGYRGVKLVRYLLRTLRAHFGEQRLDSITFETLRKFREERLSTATRRGTLRTIASVNRELQLLRRMLNIAEREGWITRNPFRLGDPLISPADENQRTRILTPEEERRLLAACDPRRSRLRAILICALDTGMRRGEILKLTWGDVDFDSGAISIRALNTKTLSSRTVYMTDRLRTELNLLRKSDSTALVFGVKDTIKTAFGRARKMAGLDDLRFHDLRHTAATRLAQGGLPINDVADMLGHKQLSTTKRYLNITDESRRRAARILERFADVGAAGGL